MNKFLIMVWMLTAGCAGAFTQDGEWRKFFASEKSLANGYVKKSVFTIKQGNFVNYEAVFQENDKIIIQRFDADFKMVREDIHEFDDEKMVLTEAIFHYDGIGATPAKIIDPFTAPFKPSNDTLVSHLEYQAFGKVSVRTVTKSVFIGYENYDFNGKELECIKFSVDDESCITDEDMPGGSKINRSTGYSLWAEDIGFVYMRYDVEGDIGKYEVVEVLTMEEFEKLKL